MSGKKFRFSLQSVLQLRRHEVERAERQLTHLLVTYKNQQDTVAAARASLQELQEDAPGRGIVDPQTVRRHYARRQEAQQAIAAAQKRLENVRRQVEESRTHLRERRRAEESLQTLYDKEKARHDKEQALADAAFLDEQAVMRHSRSQDLSA